MKSAIMWIVVVTIMLVAVDYYTVQTGDIAFAPVITFVALLSLVGLALFGWILGYLEFPRLFKVFDEGFLVAFGVALTATLIALCATQGLVAALGMSILAVGMGARITFLDSLRVPFRFAISSSWFYAFGVGIGLHLDQGTLVEMGPLGWHAYILVSASTTAACALLYLGAGRQTTVMAAT